MKLARYERLARLGIGAFLLLLIQAVSTPRAAWAGCNHLVVARFDSALEFNRLDELILARWASVSAEDRSHSPLGPVEPRRPAPCSGMNCSNRIPLPASTVSPEPRSADQWGALAKPVVFDFALALDRNGEPTTSLHGGYRPSIFHPPPV